MGRWGQRVWRIGVVVAVALGAGCLDPDPKPIDAWPEHAFMPGERLTVYPAAGVAQGPNPAAQGGAHVRPCLAVSPVQVDFGPTLAGRPKQAIVTVDNCGPTDVDALQHTVTVEHAPVGRLTPTTRSRPLRAGRARNAVIDWTPLDAGSLSATVRYHSSSGWPQATVRLLGQAVTHLPPSLTCPGEAAAEVDRRLPLVSLVEPVDNPLGGELRFEWDLRARPRGSTAEPEGDPAILTPDLPGDYRLEVTAYDADGMRSRLCALTLTARPVNDIELLLWWERQGDLDLHLMHPLGDSWGCAPRDAYSGNPNPDWGVPFDQSDDPLLLFDSLDGVRPERLILPRAEQNRTYTAAAELANQHEPGPVPASVEIWAGGALVHQAEGVLEERGDLWEIASVAWPSGQVTPRFETLRAYRPDCRR